MFHTANRHRHPILSAFAGDGQHVWMQVELPLCHPWFFVSFTQNEDDVEVRGGLFVSLLAQLIELAKLPPSLSFTLDEVMLVSPAWLNQSAGWQMERLQSIWHLPDKSDHLVYRLNDGRDYVKTHDHSVAVDRDSLTCVVSLP